MSMYAYMTEIDTVQMLNSEEIEAEGTDTILVQSYNFCYAPPPH